MEQIFDANWAQSRIVAPRMSVQEAWALARSAVPLEPNNETNVLHPAKRKKNWGKIYK